MAKFIFLPFVLMLLGLVAVMVFAPRNKAIKKFAAEGMEATGWFPWFLLALPFLAIILLVLGDRYLWPESFGIINVIFSIWYLAFVIVVSFVALIWYTAVKLFTLGVPAAQEAGKTLTDNQRRATWHRAKREFQKFRAS